MGSVDKRYQVIISERAGEMLVQHARFLAQVSAGAADKLRMDIVKAAKLRQEFRSVVLGWLIRYCPPTNTENCWWISDIC